ncbi:methyltransferase domain-containing protein [Iamia majanohamensis]|uniref:Methyltransferase domain-containing protein n=1 Tax=Iamia majanohamensis TaxID=467976 RepID=A0AAF0BX39_9ACTN|nr:methyltransferase domain-containing protein [Iamia majanohamensis]WCO68214.1 methyltransferase domain-containing protein [Iamia majanohamensis]
MSEETGPDADAEAEAEFDVMAGWTADAVAALGADHALPAACRGSGSPAALDWLADRCRLGPGTTVLDCGGGAGGAAAYAAEHTGATPVLVEPMAGACRAARRMFGLPTVVGGGDRLPLPSGAVAAAWCLGVLSTTEAHEALLRELRRVLRPDGDAGLLVLVQETDDLLGAPADLVPPSAEELDRALEGAGLAVVARQGVADLPDPPEDWDARADRVEQWVAEHHRHDRRWAVATDNEERIGRLLGDGHLSVQLLHVRPT